MIYLDRPNEHDGMLCFCFLFIPFITVPLGIENDVFHNPAGAAVENGPVWAMSPYELERLAAVRLRARLETLWQSSFRARAT